MEWIETAPDDGLNIKRFETTDGTIEYGLYQVLFGIRFRAGIKGSMIYNIDWCCGNIPENVSVAFLVFEHRLKQSNTPNEVFDGLPVISVVKPFHNDPEFMSKMALILTNKPL